MNRNGWACVSMAAAALAVVCANGCGKASAQEAKVRSTGRSVDLTVYVADFGLVREGRDLDLNEGRTRVGLQDVSKLLDPGTVIYQWDKPGPDVVSTTYDLGVSGGEGLLKRYMGRKVELLWPSENGKPRDSIEGTLESADGGTVIRSDGKFYVNPAGTIVAPADGEIVTMPHLSAEVDSPAKQKATVKVAYQTRGLSWSADYTAKLDPTSDKLELDCWATVTNHTGVDYPDARVTLVAGSPNRAVRGAARSEYPADGMMAGGRMDMDAKKEKMLEPVAVGELYAYKVPARVSIGQEQMNRVKMLASTSVPVHRDYNVALPQISPWGDYGWEPPSSRIGANLAITFDNTEAAGLGMPLPMGAVRVYDPDAEGNLQFTGAATVYDTPKDAHVALTLSKVFDVYVTRRSVKSERIDKKTTRRTIELVLHNEKKKAIPLRVVQQFYGKWKIASESFASKRPNAGVAQWIIDVPAGGEVVLRYAVDMKA